MIDGPLARLRARAAGVFPGWWLAGGAAAMQFLIAGLFLQAYGTYAPFWMAEFGWSRTAVALGFSLQRSETGLLGPVNGWLLRRFGPRAVIRVGVLLLAGGLLLLATMRSLPTFYLAILVMGVGSSLAGLLSLMTVLVNWFVRRRTTALAAMQLGSSLGGLAVPLVAWALLAFGWRPVAAASALLVLALGLPIAGRMEGRPEAVGLEPDGAAPPAPGATLPAEFRTRAALATRAFWLMSLAHAAAVAVVASVIVHYVLFLTGDLGFSVTAAATLFALLTAASIGGQVLGGFVGDGGDKRLLAALAMLGHALAMLLLARADGLALVLPATLLHGAAWGLRGPLMGALRADFFGRGAFATIMGFSALVVTTGSVGGPLLAGAVADATGGYRPAFLALAGIAALGAVGFVALRPPRGA